MGAGRRLDRASVTTENTDARSEPKEPANGGVELIVGDFRCVVIPVVVAGVIAVDRDLPQFLINLDPVVADANQCVESSVEVLALLG